METNLAELPDGATGTVVGFHGGLGLMRKLAAMGLRPGKTVRKMGSQFMAGPVTVLVDGREVAMGRGIARRVTVRVSEPAR